MKLTWFLALIGLAGLRPICSTVAAQSAMPNLYVVGRKPSEIVTLAPPEYKVTKRTPIAANPTHVTIDRANERLYVVHDGQQWGDSKQLSTLSIIDLKTSVVASTVPVAWNVSALELSEDGRSVIFQTAGSRKSKGQDRYPSYVVVDALNRSIMGIFSILGPAPMRLRTKDGKIFFVLGRPDDWNKTGRPKDAALLAIFGVPAPAGSREN
jgi:hypothetical protein